ncbi:hypothetical protein D9M68_811230 [compost metagenome]
MKDSKEIGIRLQAERNRLGLSQTEFAERLGIGLRTQASYESGRSEAKAVYLSHAAALGVDVLFVMTGVPAPTPAESLSQTEAKVLENYRALAVEDQAAVRRLTSSLAESIQNTRLNKASGN